MATFNQLSKENKHGGCYSLCRHTAQQGATEKGGSCSAPPSGEYKAEQMCQMNKIPALDAELGV